MYDGSRESGELTSSSRHPTSTKWVACHFLTKPVVSSVSWLHTRPPLRRPACLTVMLAVQ
jgi:hypothetical protein